jgi:myosin heavy subunit
LSRQSAKDASYRRQSLLDADAKSIQSTRADLCKLNLSGNPTDYFYLLQSGCTVIPMISDKDQFNEMERACVALGLSKPEVSDAFAVCASILHLGNISFEDCTGGSGGSVISNTSRCRDALEKASALMGLAAEEISLRLRTRELILRGEVNSVQLTAVQAAEARDALAKAMYKNCFDWLVERTNQAMLETSRSGRDSAAGQQENRFRRTQQTKTCIGILDIFGFEIFETNGIEQVRE